MKAERIKEIQEETPYPDSVSVQQALMKVWNECKQATHQEGAKLRKLADIIREAWTPDSELADKKGLKLYKVDFDGVWPVPCALVILAENEEAARHFAQITITHTTFFKVKEAPMIEGGVVYESGDY